MKHFINNGDMKAANTRDVFNLIRRHGSLTRKQIEEHTQLSWGTVSNITARLLEKGYLLEEKAENPGSGRIPTRLVVCGTDHFVLGVDINLIGIHMAVLNLKSEILEEQQYEADFRNRDALWNQLCRLLDQWTAAYGDRHIAAIGIGMQGKVDSRRGISQSIPRCANWQDVPIRQMVEERYGIPVFLEHDPICILHTAAQPELWPNAVLLRLDSGIGMAVMTEGRMFDVPGTCEIAHTTAVPGGIPCSCGRRGCLESYVSEGGIAMQSGKSYRDTVLSARSGNPQDRLYFTRMASCLAAAVSSITALFDPQILYLCGEMVQDADLFAEPFFRRLQEEGLRLRIEMPEKVNAATGAALLAMEHMEVDTE
ncbi:MAG: ROK family transcriptional regulator [Clostridia bacterium]|nr:ROK family transcriptional regulator [Clostridia bacterium]